MSGWGKGMYMSSATEGKVVWHEFSMYVDESRLLSRSAVCSFRDNTSTEESDQEAPTCGGQDCIPSLHTVIKK